MPDYYPVLSRALSNLGDSAGPDVRKAIYERARTALLDQLRGAEPPLPPGHIERERAALEGVIARLEAEARERARTGGPAPRDLDEDAARRGKSPVRNAEPRAGASDATSGEPEAEPAPLPDKSLGLPPGRERRSFAGLTGMAWLKMALGVVLIAVVGTLGGLAYVMRDRIDPGRREQAEQAAEQPPAPSRDAKIDARLGPSGENPSGQPAAAPAAPAPAPGAPTPAPASAQPDQQLPVSQRATLFLEVPGAASQVPRTVAGRVLWRFENLPGRPGQPLDPALVGTVEIPDADLTLRMQMTRNHDNLLPASYLLGLVFKAKDMTIKEVAPVILKASEGERGAPLVGIEQPLGDNLFVMALSADNADVAKNFDLLTKRGWVEVQFRLSDQRRGALVFEKGISGDRALLAAIDAWK
jgi:hypothetical protein